MGRWVTRWLLAFVVLLPATASAAQPPLLNIPGVPEDAFDADLETPEGIERTTVMIAGGSLGLVAGTAGFVGYFGSAFFVANAPYVGLTAGFLSMAAVSVGGALLATLVTFPIFLLTGNDALPSFKKAAGAASLSIVGAFLGVLAVQGLMSVIAPYPFAVGAMGVLVLIILSQAYPVLLDVALGISIAAVVGLSAVFIGGATVGGAIGAAVGLAKFTEPPEVEAE